MDKYVLVALPIAWASVATVIALALYKTSKAFFEEKSDPADGSVRRVRLVGSVVIAAVVFIGLWQATSTQALQELSAGQIQVSAGRVSELKEAVRTFRLAVDEHDACLSMAAADQCEHQATRSRSAAEQLATSADMLESRAQ